MQANHKWWGRWSFRIGEVRRWQIGPATLWIHRLPSEWRIAHTAGSDSLDTHLEVAAQADAGELDNAASMERYACPTGGDSVFIQPALADRPIVSRPRAPFHIAAGDRVPIHVSSPLWIAIAFQDATAPTIELPTYRPSDTWLGPNTREGELCYAVRTSCRLELDELPQRPHRAVTTVAIVNETDEPLRLERLSVPVTHLSLFYGDNQHLWTEDIKLKYEDPSDGLAELDIRSGTPRAITGASKVTGPRLPQSESSLVRAFSALL